METLQTLFPDVKDLLAIPPEDLAPLLLKLARNMIQNGMFYPETVNNVATGANDIVSPQAGYGANARMAYGSSKPQLRLFLRDGSAHWLGNVAERVFTYWERAHFS